MAGCELFRRLKSGLLVGLIGALCWGSSQQLLALPAVAVDQSTTWLSQMLQQTDKQHPALKALEQRLAAARAALPAATALPDPMLFTSITHVGLARWSLGEDGMSNIGLMLEQNYPHPIKLQLREQMAYRDLRELEAAAHQLRRQLRQQVVRDYLQLARLHQNLRINAEMQALATRLEQMVTAYVSLGQMPQTEIWQLKLQRSQLENQALSLESQLASVRHQLHEKSFFTDLPADQPQAFPALPAQLPSQADLLQGLAGHPQIQRSTEQLIQAELGLKQAEAELSPDFVLAGGLSNRLLLEPMWELRLGMTLPAYSQQKQLPEIERSRHTLAAQHSALEAGIRQLQRQLQQNWSQQAFAHLQAQKYRQQLLPEARQSVEASLAALVSRQIPLSQVLERFQRWLEIQREALEADSTYLEAWAELEYLSGRDVF